MKSTLALQYPMELLARGAVLAAAMLTNFKFKEPLPESDSASHGGSSAASASWREILLSHEFPRAQMEGALPRLRSHLERAATRCVELTTLPLLYAYRCGEATVRARGRARRQRGPRSLSPRPP